VLPNIPVIPGGSAYIQTNFVSDIPGLAFIQDPLCFIFASEAGDIIVGWNPGTGPNSTTGVIVAAHPSRKYTGLAIGSNSGGNRLYAADFTNGNIDSNILDTLSSASIQSPQFNPHNLFPRIRTPFSLKAPRLIKKEIGAVSTLPPNQVRRSLRIHEA
jgi:hypothetical protein